VSSSNRRSGGRERLIGGRFVLPGLCLSIALLMIWLALPRAVAGLILFDAESTLTSLRLGETVPATERASLLARQRSALAWSSAGGPLIGYSFAVMASQARDSADGKKANLAESIAAAAAALRTGLSRMPVSAEGWLMLALLRRGAAGGAAKAISAVRMSVFTGPHVPVLAVVRLRLMFRLWPQFAKDERQLVYGQVRFAWSIAPDDVVEMAASSQNNWPIRIALSLQPKELQRFEEKLRAAKKAASAKSK